MRCATVVNHLRGKKRGKNNCYAFEGTYDLILNSVAYLLDFHFAAAGTSTGGRASCFQPIKASNALK